MTHCIRLSCSVALVLAVTCPAFGQAEGQAQADPWAMYRPLAGAWEGGISGQLGTGKAVRTYEFILDGQFLLLRHASVRLPQRESPTGDHHRELGVFSYDDERGAIVYRQFIVEGYVLESSCVGEPAERRIVCTTERIENGEGMRARETIHFLSDHEFEETFELASPGGELEVLFENRWTRVPRLD